MTARTRRQPTHTGTVLAAGLIASVAASVLLMPVAAHAATPSVGSSSASGLTYYFTGGGSGTSHALQPGGNPQTFTLTVTNSSDKAEPFAPEFTGKATGALALSGAVATLTLAGTSGGTPASTVDLGSQDSGLLGFLYPAGAGQGQAFSIPAHATYNWNLALGVTKQWPVNDDALALSVFGNGATRVGGGVLDFPVGAGGTGGPMVETLSNTGSTVSPGHPLETTLTITNKTGAALADQWPNEIVYGADRKGEDSSGVTLVTDVWDGGKWQQLGQDGSLPTIEAGFANGASVSYKLRVRVLSYDSAEASVPVSMFVWGGGGPGTTYSLTKELTVLRSAATASASASAATSASATASAPASATASASAPSSAVASPSAAAGSLAHTGGGSGTSLLAGIALVLLGAGSAVLVGLKRRTRRG